MSDSPRNQTRDEIEQAANIDVGFEMSARHGARREEIADILAPFTADESDVDWCDEAADALIRAFPVLSGSPVPPGLTAERLREIAYRHTPLTWCGADAHFREDKRLLREWADVLDSRPPNEPERT